MAEGDTIHRLARRLGAALGERVLDEARAPARRSPLRLQRERLAALAGRRFERARAHGKHLLLDFEGGLSVHSHLGMNGSWRVTAAGHTSRRPLRSAWLALRAGDVTAAQFGGTRLVVATAAELRADRRLRMLGPDILGGAPSVAAARDRLAAADAGRELGDVLLDQRLVAGIGNIFKSEACHAAGVSPWRRLGDLEGAELDRVVVAAARLMGDSLESGRPPRGVYRRAGAACPRCGHAIRSRGQGDANRTTYWCPACQR